MNFKKWIKREIVSKNLMECSRNTPALYNKLGEEMNIWFLQDKLTEHTPYSLNAAYFPNRIVWDRFNSSLPIRFYAHSALFDKREDGLQHDDYALLYESEAIIPQTYEEVIKRKTEMVEYNKLFTCSERILNMFENARFVPGNGVWYGSEFQGGEWKEDRYRHKSKGVSIISSNKMDCEGHKIRVGLANHFLRDERVDAFGSFGGICLPKKNIALDDYRFSIVIENDIQPLYFTEKILDCFAAQVVPIYVGATEISRYFNSEGIIQVKKNEIDKIDEIVRKCDEQCYVEKIGAIKDNYARVKKYICVEDYILENYF